jgi:hypothetical protein
MLEELLRADRLSQVIDHTTALAFLLGMMGLSALFSIAMIGYLYGCDVSTNLAKSDFSSTANLGCG